MNVHLTRILHIFHVEAAEYVNSLLTLSLSMMSLDLTKKSFMLLPKETFQWIGIGTFEWSWQVAHLLADLNFLLD
jgi:hypothetical protein